MQRVDSWRVGVDFVLMSLKKVLAVLINQLNAVQADVVKIAMRRVEVESHAETNRHADCLVLLEEVDRISVHAL